MAQNKVNMSLDEIIQAGKPRGRGRGRGVFRGARGLARGRPAPNRSTPNRPALNNNRRSNSTTRAPPALAGRLGRGGQTAGRAGRSSGRVGRGQVATQAVRGRSRSRSRVRIAARLPRGNGVVRGRGQLRGRLSRRDTMPNTTAAQNRASRSGSRTRFRNNQNIAASRSRSRSRSRTRGVVQQAARGRGRGGRQNLLTRGISTDTLRNQRPTNKFSRVGLRSDLILKAQKLNYVQNKINRARSNVLAQNQNLIHTQTFTRSRARSRSRSKGPAATRLTVSVANEFANQRRPLNRKRRNSNAGLNRGIIDANTLALLQSGNIGLGIPNLGYLDKNSLALLGGGQIRRGPASVRSMGSNRSRRSNRSTKSDKSTRSQRGGNRGRGGRGGPSNRPTLNPRLQQEIAAIQGRAFANGNEAAAAIPGINFTPTPHLTTTSLSERFAKM